MKSRAAVAFAAGKPLEIVEIDVDPPKKGEVLIRITRRPTQTRDAAGEVVRVLERATRTFVGTYFERDGQGYVLVGADAQQSGRWPLDRPPCPLETTVPRLICGGDLRAGSTKRVGFAVGDGSLAVTCVHRLRGL